MKQLAANNLEFQQTMSSSNMQFQQNMNATIQDLKMQIGQLANTMSHLHYFEKWKRIATASTAIVSQQEKTIPLQFPTRTLSTIKAKSDEELLRMFWKVEINISLLDALKQIPEYAKFLKELSETGKPKSARGDRSDSDALWWS
ncbi:hypothetical protein CR513_19213, partial [Mucuna pruriens]